MNNFDPIFVQHCDGASSCWLSRDSAVGEPHYSLRDLAEHDGVLQSHLEGLQLAGEDGWQLAVEGLEWGEPGEVFVAALLALDSGDETRIDRLLQTVGDSAELRRPLISALGWLPWPAAEPLAIRFAASDQPFLRYAGVAAFEVQRRDPGDRLANWLDDPDPTVQARACQAVGTLARRDLLDRVESFAESGDVRLAANACWTRALLLQDARVIERLLEWAQADDADAERAARPLMSMLPLDRACELINQLTSGSQSQCRLATVLSGLLGIPDSVPWLIEMMRQPEYARVAGESFARITGLRLDQRPLEGEWPDGFEAGPNDDPNDENVEMDADENLPWPDAAVVANWWNTHGDHFQTNVRYLLGWEIANASWLRKILVLGRQRERATAALELALAHPAEGLFEVRANGNCQKQQLHAARLPSEEYRCNHLEAGPQGDATWLQSLDAPSG